MPRRPLPPLLFGPSRAPALRVGDRATCLFRDRLAVVTSGADAPISWPRCRAWPGHRGMPGLLVNDELARAIRRESAAAIKFHWGVNGRVVWQWRRALA